MPKYHSAHFRFVVYIIVLAQIIFLSLQGCQNRHFIKTVQVTVSPDGPALLVDYRFPEMRSALVLEAYNTPQRQAAWVALDKAFVFDGQTLKRQDGQPFIHAVFKVMQDPRFFDRHYIVVDEIGPKSWSVFMNAFAPNKEPWQFRFAPKEGLTARLDDHPVKLGEFLTLKEGEHMAYYGKQAYVREIDGTVIVAGPDITESFIDTTMRYAVKVSTRLTKSLGAAPNGPITFYFATGNYDGKGFMTKGGLLSNNVITQRFRGIALTDPDIVTSQMNMVAHETGHLWIGGLYENAQNEKQSWAHEGTTEYLTDRVWQDQHGMKTELEQRLNKCISGLGMRPLNGDDGPVTGSVPYDCGYVLSAAAESSALKKNGDTITDIWKNVFARAEDNSYQPLDFLTAASELGGSTFRPFANYFLLGGEEARWEGVKDAAAYTNIVLKQRETPELPSMVLNGKWLNLIMEPNCTAAFGIYRFDNYYQLDTNEGCSGPLAGAPEVNSVDGIRFIENPYKAYQHAKTVCEKRGELTIGLKAGGTLPPVKCVRDVEPLPIQFDVVSMPDLPPLP